ncbi:hypothetical protein A8B78_11230 [Jannaschia sp. EhC01]|nr:hypothetical protein A8B78_11230 [Jannaschia sp. EhC01]
MLCLPSTGDALELAFPGTADLVSTTPAVDGQHLIATGPWSDTGLPTHAATGAVQQFTWRITGEDISTAGLLTSLRDQIEAQGFTVPFTCFATACGGFDFRHALSVGSAPEMHVDLGDFHYLSALSEDGETEAALMISRGGATGFVHLALIQPPSQAEAPVIQSTRTPDPGTDLPETPPTDLIALLTAFGAAPLEDLQFQTGASELSGERYASLTALAAFLAEDPTRQVVLVGHTDALGSLSGNIALSRARALAVRQFLTEELGVVPTQVEAQGIGFLAPRAPNTTPEGREANRRVEVVLANP